MRQLNSAIIKLARDQADRDGVMTSIFKAPLGPIIFRPTKYTDRVRLDQLLPQEQRWNAVPAKELYQVVPGDPAQDREIPSELSPLMFVVNDR